MSINDKLYKLNNPFIQVSFNGINLSGGPLIVPGKTACMECGISYELKQLNAKIPADQEISISDLGGINFSCSLRSDVHNSRINYVIDVIQRDLISYYNNSKSDFIDCRISFDLKSINFTREERLPTTHCNYCNAFNKNYIRITSKPADVQELLNCIADVNKTILNDENIEYRIGGLRSRSEKETKELLQDALNKLGAKVRIEPSYGNPFNDNETIHCYNSFIDQTHENGMPYLVREHTGAGKGLTKSQSYFSAAFELLEHISLQYTGDVSIICASYNDVKEIAIDVPHLAGTIMNKNTSFDDFIEDKEIDWVVANSLTNGEKKLVPAFLVFMYDVELKGTLFGPTSSGAASGVTLEDAILHGLFEAVERDAWIIGQANPYVLPKVDYSTLKNERLTGIISRIKAMGYEIVTRDYTNDIGIPVYRTWIYNKNDYSRYAYMGFGCHVSPEVALERSITEAVQVDDWSTTGGEVESDMITLSVLSESLVNLYNQHTLVIKDILGETDQIVSVGEPIFEMKSTNNLIKKISNQIKERVAGDVYYVELTKPGMNVKVARTIITGDFQNLNIPLISASRRIFEFGIRCGYSDTVTIYEELFMGKYQH